MNISLGDCIEVMREMEACSVDAIVTDPPYGLEFMGKDWDRLGDVARANRGTQPDRKRPPGERGDSQKFQLPAAFDLTARSQRAMQEWHYRWAVEALRVLKPGGHLLAFGGTRTYHRLAVAVEDAGFEIRDCLAWMYGSGFPKSLDVSKAIDKAAGVEREVVGVRESAGYPDGGTAHYRNRADSEGSQVATGGAPAITAPATDDAARWEGWGTALKPAFEPVVVARKPLVGTVAANVLAHGVGAINVDACRIATGDPLGGGAELDEQADKPEGWDRPWRNDPDAQAAHAARIRENVAHAESLGRWPANVILGHSPDCVPAGTREVKGDGNWSGTTESVGYEGGWDTSDHPRDQRVPRVETVEVWECVEDCPIRLLDEQTGECRSAGEYAKGSRGVGDKVGAASIPIDGLTSSTYADFGGASRFFYCAKTSRAERNAGLDGFEKRPMLWSSGEQNPGSFQADSAEKAARNNHPTVKPIDVMRWLLRLVVPPGGTVLDPFLGSGSTGCAAVLEGFDFIGIELDPDYLAIAEARIRFWDEHGDDGLRIVQERAASERVRTERAATGQMDLLAMTDHE